MSAAVQIVADQIVEGSLTRFPTATESRQSLKDATDGELIARVAQQDRKAFDVLYRRHHGRLLNFIQRKIRSEALAQEIVSDVMLVLWQSAASFAGASSVVTWLYGVAHRQMLRSLERNRKHSAAYSDDEFLASTADAHPHSNPEAVAIADSENQLLELAMATLSKEHRAVVELTATGHNSVEIAQMVGCLENTVRTRLFHARQQLQRFLVRANKESATQFAPAARVAVPVQSEPVRAAVEEKALVVEAPVETATAAQIKGRGPTRQDSRQDRPSFRDWFQNAFGRPAKVATVDSSITASAALPEWPLDHAMGPRDVTITACMA
jgi:RNA polymerase sigma-70 factor (ECF subfamily)